MSDSQKGKKRKMKWRGRELALGIFGKLLLQEEERLAVMGHWSRAQILVCGRLIPLPTLAPVSCVYIASEYLRLSEAPYSGLLNMGLVDGWPLSSSELKLIEFASLQ